MKSQSIKTKGMKSGVKSPEGQMHSKQLETSQSQKRSNVHAPIGVSKGDDLSSGHPHGSQVPVLSTSPSKAPKVKVSRLHVLRLDSSQSKVELSTNKIATNSHLSVTDQL